MTGDRPPGQDATAPQDGDPADPADPADEVIRQLYRQLDRHLLPGEEPYDVEAGLARLMAWAAGHAPPAQGDPGGEPLTHFPICWRWPEHHRCAVTLIGRQQEENSQLTGRAAAAERAVRDLAEAFGGTIGIDPRPPNPEFPWKVTTVDGAEWHTSAPDAAAAELIRHHRVTARNRTPCPDCGGGYWQDYIGPPPVSQFNDHDCASDLGVQETDLHHPM